MDTSCSSRGSFKGTVDADVFKTSLEKDKNVQETRSTNISDDDGEDLYDNDLAAFLEQASFPSDDEISEWRRMSSKMDEFQKQVCQSCS